MIGPVRVLAAIAGVALVVFASHLASSGPASADVRSGQYSLEVAVGESNVAGGAQFAAYLGVYHNSGDYAAVQWNLDYPETVVDVVGISKDPGAPGACSVSNDNGSRVLVGCIEASPDTSIGFSGNAWIVAFKCIGNGTVNLTLATGSSPTSVLDLNSNDKPAHIHNDTVQCGSGGPPPPPPPPPPAGDACTVASVLTGDTLTCTDGKTVRMLQIDAQDPGQCGGEWAKAALQFIFLIPGRTVTLTYDADKTDAQGRTLAAPIWRGNDGADYNLSIVMVYVGLAKAADLGDGNVMLLDWARASETWAHVAQWNMWAPNKTYTGGCD